MSHLDTRILVDLAEGVEAGRYPEELLRRFLERPWLVSSVYRNERKLWEILAGQEVLERVWTANLSHAAWLEARAAQPTTVQTSSGRSYASVTGYPRQLALTPSGVPLFLTPRREQMPGEEQGGQDLHRGDEKFYPPVKGLETFACFADGGIATLAQEGKEWVVAFKDQTRRFPNQYQPGVSTRWDGRRNAKGASHGITLDYEETLRARPQLYIRGSQVFCWVPGDGLYACSVDPPRLMHKTAPVVTAPDYPNCIGAYHRATDQVLWHDEGEEGGRPAGWFCNGEPVKLPCVDDRLQGGFLHDGTRLFLAVRRKGEWLSGQDSAEIYAGDRTISVQGPYLEYVHGLAPSQIVLGLHDRQGLAICALAPDQMRVDQIPADAARFDRLEGHPQYAGDRGVAFIGIARNRSACYLMDWTGRLVQQGPQYRCLKQLTVSPDGAHWAAIASNRDEHGAPQFVVVDGASGRLHPAIEQVVWYDSATLRYLVNKAPEHGRAPQYCAYEVALGKDEEEV